MNKYYQLILAAALSGLIFPVAAKPLSYTFVSLDYSKFSSGIDKYSADLDGNEISFDLSVALRPHAALVASYSRGNANINASGPTANADVDSVSLGIILHVPINDATDFFLGASFINGEVTVHGDYSGNEDADGGMTTIGIRAKTSDKLELNGFFRRSRIEDVSNHSMHFGAAYFVNESVSIDLGYSLDSDGGAFTLGATKYF